MIRRRLIAAGLLACAVVLTGCGGGDDDSGEQADRPPPEARPDQFPSANGKTLVQLYNELPAGGPVLAQSLDHRDMQPEEFNKVRDLIGAKVRELLKELGVG